MLWKGWRHTCTAALYLPAHEQKMASLFVSCSRMWSRFHMLRSSMHGLTRSSQWLS